MVKVPDMGFNGKKLKPLLQQAIIRIQMTKQKRGASIQAEMKMIAKLLGDGQIEKARLNTERIVKTDWYVEALDLIELYCETVRDNAPSIAAEKLCPIDIEEAVITLIYAAARTEISELKAVAKQFKMKYGKEFVAISQENRGGVVNDRIVHKLSGARPNAFLVVNYMKEIAAKYQVNWTPDELDQELGERFDTAMVTPSGIGVQAKRGAASGLGGGAYAYTDGRIMAPGKKPLGYVPIPKELQDDEIDKKGGDDDNNDDDDENQGGGGGGNVQREEDGVPGHAVRKEPKPQPKQEDDIEALAARFAKLKKM